MVTNLRADMKLVPPYASATWVECPQGQRLEWWAQEPESGQQWFRGPAEPERCAQRLWRQVRPWFEPAQSLEKNQWGWGQMFFHSLRRTGQMSLWADRAGWLRTMAWLDSPREPARLAGGQAGQLEFGLPAEH